MLQQERFVYIWKYTVRDEFIEAFLTAYGPEGTWAEFFKNDENYLGTDLLRDDSNDNTFMTIDYWTSKSARDDFRAKNETEFNHIDRQCEEFTVDEKLIGDFSIVDDAGH